MKSKEERLKMNQTPKCVSDKATQSDNLLKALAKNKQLNNAGKYKQNS